MEAYDIVKNSRNADRWCASDYIKLLITDFLELHGDRKYGDDKAVIAGIGKLLDRPITVIGIEREMISFRGWNTILAVHIPKDIGKL